MKLSIVNQISVSKDLSQHTNLAEKAGDVFLAPARLFFGRSYRLENTSDKKLILKSPETFSTFLRAMAKVAAIVLFPLTAIAAFFGLVLKAIALKSKPGLSEKYDLPAILNARTEENFSGRLPPLPFSPNCVSTQQRSRWGKHYNAEPIAIPQGIQDPIKELKTLLQTANRQNYNSQNAVLTEERDGYLHYEYTVNIPTGALKGVYIDDIDIYYDAKKHHFDIRSASRKGFRDAVNLNFSLPGANKKRIEAIRDAFADHCKAG